MVTDRFSRAAAEAGRLMSRELALTAASQVVSHREQEDRVLAAYGPIEAFLLGGDPDDVLDLRARRKAVRQHLDNLLHAVSAGRVIPAGDTGSFLAAARKYYARLASPPPSDEADIDQRRVRMREILAGCGDAGCTAYRLSTLLAQEGLTCPRETVRRWLREDAQAGLVQGGGAPGDRWRWTAGGAG